MVPQRALRRHHRERMIAHALRLYVSSWLGTAEDWDALMERARRNYNHLAACSCWMCGHRRETEGPTVQEKRLWLSACEELDPAG